MSNENETQTQERYLRSKVRQAAHFLGLALQDALEEEKGIDLPEIQNYEDDYAPYVVIDGCTHPLYAFIIPEQENVEWVYVISPSHPELKDSVRMLYDGVIKDRYEKLDAAIDNYTAYQEQL